MSKKKPKIDSISERLGHNHRKTDLEKAKEVLAKAKKLNSPVKYLKSSDSSFGRELEEKKKIMIEYLILLIPVVVLIIASYRKKK